MLAQGRSEVTGRLVLNEIPFVCRADVAYNKSVRLHSFSCGALGIVLPALFILSLIANTVSREQLDDLLGEGPARSVTVLTVRPLTDGGVLRHGAVPP